MLLALGEDCLPCKPRSVDLDSLQGLQVYVNNASLGGKPMLPPSPYAWVLMERRKLLCTPRSPGNPAVQLIPSAPIANLKRWTKSHRRHPHEKTKKAGIDWRGTVDHAGVPRQSTIRVTLDTYTQAIATEKRNAQDPWSRCCSEERRKKQARPGRDSTVCTYFVSLCACAKNGTFLIRCLILNRGATVSNPRPLP